MLTDILSCQYDSEMEFKKVILEGRKKFLL